jgi:hypothetical protein
MLAAISTAMRALGVEMHRFEVFKPCPALGASRGAGECHLLAIAADSERVRPEGGRPLCGLSNAVNWNIFPQAGDFDIDIMWFYRTQTFHVPRASVNKQLFWTKLGG